jgi:hypothetical protein
MKLGKCDFRQVRAILKAPRADNLDGGTANAFNDLQIITACSAISLSFVTLSKPKLLTS